MPRRIVTQQQAAKVLGIGDRTIRNWISEGLITGYRLPSGRAIRVDLDEITSKMKAIPTAFRPKQPFGPKAKIVDLSHAIEALPPHEDRADGQGQDHAEAVTGGER
jgi:excisionase family DNA binding protein